MIASTLAQDAAAVLSSLGVAAADYTVDDGIAVTSPIDGSVIGAFIFYVEEDSLSMFKQSWRYPRPAYAAMPKELQHAA